jgi:hypothetical protein
MNLRIINLIAAVVLVDGSVGVNGHEVEFSLSDERVSKIFVLCKNRHHHTNHVSHAFRSQPNVASFHFLFDFPESQTEHPQVQIRRFLAKQFDSIPGVRELGRS